jgi:hypothetical protein
MTFEDAVTLVFGGLTARGFLQQAHLAPGAAVLINGALGAVGTASVGYEIPAATGLLVVAAYGVVPLVAGAMVLRRRDA